MAIRDTSRRKLTYQDYVEIPEDLQRHEILEGEHYVSPSPSMAHQRIAGRLYLKLATFAEARSLGDVFFAPLDVLLSPHDIAQPDLLFIARANLDILTDLNVQGAPNLVIEILSDSTRRTDETVKLRRYGQLGVEEYWIFDPRRRAVRVFRRSGPDGFSAPRELTGGAGRVLTTPLLPGLEIPLGEIFA
jgi:Uma2 family endonuclease